MKRAALLALLAAAVAVSAAAAGDDPLWTVPRPPFPTAQRTKAPPADAPTLALASSTRNAITDTRAWFTRNGLALRAYETGGLPGGSLSPALPPLPAWVPETYRGASIVTAIRQKHVVLAIYGADGASGRYVVCLTPGTGAVTCALDLARYAYAPVTLPGEREFVWQEPRWAALVGRVLYVGTSHSTYARSSGGMNAYITAFDLDARKVLWRNGPLLANSRNFDVVGNWIVTGYGFTAEPDYLYLVDRRDGRAVQRLAVPSGPEYVLRRGREIFVRTYDHDLVVELRAR